MKRFLLRFAIVLIVPVLALLAIYVYFDPFKVIFTYDDYYPTDMVQPELNKGAITIAVYEKNDPTQHYDSFIFGPSVSMGIPVAEWRKHISAESKPIHFDSSGESLKTTRKKIEYLLARGTKIRNALIVIPADIFSFEDFYTLPKVNSWKVDPEMTFLKFHSLFIKSFFNREYFRSYMALKIFGREANVSFVKGFSAVNWSKDYIINEWEYENLDKAIKADPSNYVMSHLSFHPKDTMPEELQSFLTPEYEAEVRRIASLLQKEGTDYHVIISPKSDKGYINNKDLKALTESFGAERTHDFTQSLNSMIDTDTCFYDLWHFRPCLGAEMVRRTFER